MKCNYPHLPGSKQCLVQDRTAQTQRPDYQIHAQLSYIMADGLQNPEYSEIPSLTCDLDSSSHLPANCASGNHQIMSIPADLGSGLPDLGNFINSPREKFERMASFDYPFDEELANQGISRIGTNDHRPVDYQWAVKSLTQPRPPTGKQDLSLINPAAAFDKFRRLCTASWQSRQEMLMGLFPFLMGTALPNPAASWRVFGNVETLARDGSLLEDRYARLPQIQPAVFWASRYQMSEVPANIRACARLAMPAVGGVPAGGPNPSVLVAPNMFLEICTPHEAIASAVLECRHNGAFGARAIYNISGYDEWTYTQARPVPPLDYDGRSLAFSAAYGDGQLKLFAHWMVWIHVTNGTQIQSFASSLSSIDQEQLPQVEYRMVQLGAWSISGDADTFKRGVIAFRNLVDLATTRRRGAISMASR